MANLEDHLKRIAPSGGIGRAKRYSKKQLSEWGKKGGRPKKSPENKAK